MPIHELAGKPAPKELLIDPDALVAAYYANRPDMADPQQRVSFGTSGHRGTALDSSFTESHILAVTQAICDYRKREGITGPLFLGRDTHALSEPAEQTAIEVLAANDVHTFIAADGEPTPTPVISHCILRANREKPGALSDGIVVTPSHNPPADGGFKYNPPHGGPADAVATKWIEDRANALLAEHTPPIKRLPFERALQSGFVKQTDFITGYVEDLGQVVDLAAIAASGLRVGVDPLGGASLRYWERIASRYRLSLDVVNDSLDPRFSFMTVDHDGKIRMDCSSPYAMAKLLALKDRYDVAFGNDPDADRHGIVTPSAGLLNPNSYLAVCVSYLFAHRERWPAGAGIGKTLVSSSVIDRVAALVGRKVVEVPVGFKWFVQGLLDSSLGFAGEESAGASFLRLDGTVWTTDKDGIILNLLACEIAARTKKDPGQIFAEITDRVGKPYYRRVDQGIDAAMKERFKKLTPENITAKTLASESILRILTRAPGNNEPIGGVKVVTEDGWFAARPSGTENVYKLYAESLKSEEHLASIITEGQQMVDAALKA